MRGIAWFCVWFKSITGVFCYSYFGISFYRGSVSHFVSSGNRSSHEGGVPGLMNGMVGLYTMTYA